MSTVAIAPSALHGMLTDLLRSTSKDATIPALNTIELFTADHAGTTVLAGVSTDRFRLGHAFETCAGKLNGKIHLPRDSATRLVKVLAAYKKQVGVLVTVEDDKLTLDTFDSQKTVALDVDAAFPDVKRFFVSEPSPEGLTLAFNPGFLADFAAIAKRRKAQVSLQPGASSVKPARVRIGDTYTGVIMPVRLADANQAEPALDAHVKELAA